MKKFLLVGVPLVLIAAAAIGACSRRSAGGGQAQLLEIAQSRGLSPEDAARAIKTFVAPGGRDEYMLFASGGHSGQVHVISVPLLAWGLLAENHLAIRMAAASLAFGVLLGAARRARTPLLTAHGDRR